MLALGLFCLLLLALYGWRSWESRDRRLHEAQAAAASLAQAAVRQTDDAVTAADLALAAVVRDVAGEMDRDDFFGDLAEALATRAASLPQVAGLFVFDADGNWVANSLRAMPRDVNNAQRDYFIRHRDTPDLQSHVGSPVKSRISGEWVLPVSRRISRPDGSFAGVALATIPLSYLHAYYQQIGPDKHSEVAVLSDRGAVLTRHPFQEAALGADVAASGLFRAYLGKPTHGVLTERSLVDGVLRVYAYRRSERYALLVAAGVSHEAWFAPWKKDAMLQGAAVLGLTMLIAAGAAGFVRQRRRSLYLERRLRASERRLADLADNLPLLALRVDAEHRVGFCNATCRTWFGIAPEAGRQPHLADVAGGALYEQLRPVLERALAGERTEFDCVAMIRGEARSLRMVCMPDRRHDGAVQGAVVLGSDITAQKAGERRIRAIADNTPALIAFVDTDLRFAYSNGHVGAAAGIDAGQMLGRTMEEVHGTAIFAMLEAHALAALAGQRVQFEYSVDQGGERRVLHNSYVPERDGAGRVIGFYSLTNDVTAFKEAEQKLSRLARFDALTGLPNRSHLTERLAEALQRSDRNGRAVAVLRIEIDRFDELIDSLGHQGGDDLLKELAARLLRSCRSTDMVARLGSDEFVVLMEGLAQAGESRLVADKVMEAMRQPFMAAGAAHELAVTVGIALRHGEVTAPDALLRQAGVALRSAKAASRAPEQKLAG